MENNYSGDCCDSSLRWFANEKSESKMFLILSLLVVTVIYWFSVVLSETIYVSEGNSGLPTAIRMGLAFFFSVAYFATAWQLVSIDYVWLFGIALLVLYAYGRYGGQFISVIFLRIANNIREYLKYFFIFLIGANVFFAPLFVVNNYGPFTEGGGDVSIYADVTNILASRKLTSDGRPGRPAAIPSNLVNVFDVSYDRHLLNERADRRYRTFDAKTLSPPVAEAAVNRVLALRSMSPFIYTPFAQYNFLATDTNYHVFYGVLAFLYCLILVGAWSFFIAFGNKVALLAVSFFLFSHGLLSVFYNVYAMQALSIALTLLILNALRHVRFNSWTGLKTYGVGIGYLWASYVHFLSLLVPLALFAWSSRFFNFFEKNKSPENHNAVVGMSRNVATWFVAIIFFVLLVVLFVGGSKNSVLFIKDLVTNAFGGANNAFMGDQTTLFGWNWFSFYFGLLSQQHYLPFAREFGWLIEVVHLGVVAGFIVLFLGAASMIKIYRKKNIDATLKGFFGLYILLILIVSIHMYVTQSSIYVQAKGAQNVVSCIYLIALIPLALGLSDVNLSKTKLTKTLLISCILFTICLALPRLVYTLKVAAGHDRGFILESSYFHEAQKIRKADALPFILFEPRKSADLYLGNQPFFGAKAISTRHLVLQKLNMDTRPVSSIVVLGPDLIQPSDVPHIWLLRAEKKERWPSLRVSDYEWKANKLIDMKDPVVLLFAHDYERDFEERDVNLGAIKKQTFSYLRHGAAMLYLPSGVGGDLQIILEPRDANGYEEMVSEIQTRLNTEEIDQGLAISQDGKQVMLTASITAIDEPRLIRIARYSGEFWLSVVLDGKQL